METILEQPVSAYHQSVGQPTISQHGAWNRFIGWCAGQEENRFVWLGVALTSHGCLLTPLTLSVVMMTGNNMVFYACNDIDGNQPCNKSCCTSD